MKRVASIPAPTASAVPLSELKAHLRVLHADEDALIEGTGMAATAYVEMWTQRALSPRDAVLRLAATPSCTTPIDLPGGMVNSLTSLTVDGVAVTGLAVIGDSPALVVPSADWPVATGDGYPVVINYNVGTSVVPKPLQIAVAMIAAEIYEQRRIGSDKAIMSVPVSAEYMMRPFRIWPI
jgi:uncharacterized phiE125 gp8 family phage protein